MENHEKKIEKISFSNKTHQKHQKIKKLKNPQALKKLFTIKLIKKSLFKKNHHLI
jgi:hypothetical protein